jgi:hypothetical protein
MNPILSHFILFNDVVLHWQTNDFVFVFVLNRERENRSCVRFTFFFFFFFGHIIFEKVNVLPGNFFFFF